MQASKLELEMAETTLLQSNRIALNGAVVPIALCQHILAREQDVECCDAAAASALSAQLISGQAVYAGRVLTDKEKKAVVAIYDRLLQLARPIARHLVRLVVSANAGLPTPAQLKQFEKLAEAKRVALVSLALAHLKEARRRADDIALEQRLAAERARQSPAEREAFVNQALQRAGFR